MNAMGSAARSFPLHVFIVALALRDLLMRTGVLDPDARPAESVLNLACPGAGSAVCAADSE